MIDIQSLRGLDAHRSADAELAARLVELNSEADGRPFTPDQQVEFEGILGQREELAGIVKELELREAAVAEATQKPNGVEMVGQPVFNAPNVISAPDDVFDLVAYRNRVRDIDDLPKAYRDGAMRIVEKAQLPTAPDKDAARDRLAELIDKHASEDYGVVSRRVIGTTSPTYREAWARYVSGGLQAVPPRLMAALQTYSEANGGYAIPVDIDPSFVLTTDGAVNPLRDGMARVETITTKQWSPVTTGGVTASYAAETAAASDSAPSDVASPAIAPIRAHVAVDFSAEYSEDYGPAAISSELGRLIADAKNVLEAEKFVNGNGSGEPTGIVFALSGSASVVGSAASGTFALGDIDSLEGDLGDRFIGRAQFLGARIMYQKARGFGTAGQPANSIYDPLSNTLRGYPARISNNMDKTTTDTSEVLVFGDFQHFVIVDRLGLSTEFIPMVFNGDGRPLGRRGVYARWRNDTGLTTINAFRLLTIGAGS